MTVVRARLGWSHVAGLGVALVVAGQFSGWNYGLAASGWGNMVAATLLMALLCFGLGLCLAELSAARPHAGGLYVYCADAFGPLVGSAVGCAVFVALSIGTGAAAEFVSAYASHVLGFGGWPLKLVLFAAILTLHLRGAGEAMRMMMAAGALAVAGLLLFDVAMMPHFDSANLVRAGERLHVDPAGIFACIPYAIWLFISVEQSAAASEDVDDPARNMPRGIIAAVATLLISGLGVLVLGAGAGGIERIGTAADPLYAALAGVPAGVPHWVIVGVGLSGILGLIATLFSLIYAASRQLFALARDGFMIAPLARTNRFGSPHLALLLVGSIGLAASAVPPDRILLAVVLSLSASYIVLLAAFVRLRRTRPDLARPFRAWGGVGLAGLCLALAITLFLACFRADPRVLIGLGLLIGCAAGTHLLRRHRAVIPFERTVDVV
ncbi:amino acid permease [Rhizorhabdus sp. FW153]|uniref:amino acid permease n=1 Tax=Rhizorhabdus sp. FW153 TaxID=3400216 RepID=UPI003CE82E69